MEALLGRCVASWFPGATGVAGAVRLSGGASQETWSFDIVHPAGNVGAILRTCASACADSRAGMIPSSLAQSFTSDRLMIRWTRLHLQQLGSTLNND